MHPKTFHVWETVATCATGALGLPPMSLPLAWSLLCIGRVVLNFDSPGYEAKPRNDGRVAGPTPKAEGPPLRFEGRGGHLRGGGGSCRRSRHTTRYPVT